MTAGRTRVGIDIGGTFTDLVLATAEGAVHTLKVPSTADDYSRAIGQGLAELLGMAGLDGGALDEVLHATTVASNAILEGKGARTGLITTRGFRDILEIRTLRMPRLYDLTWQKPPVLVERALRREVVERLDHRGRVQIALDEDSVVEALRHLRETDVESVAIVLLHSYANDAHERRIAELAARHAPDLALSLSCEVLPEIREYERTSTTVINAYVGPVVGGYLERLRGRLERAGAAAPLLLMRSSGGLMPAEEAARFPVHIVESGPAAGVAAAMALAGRLGIGDIISFDMGGTTAKAALVEAGKVSSAAEFQVGGGIMSGSRLLTGAGYTLRIPAIDLAEVGAGGGSVVWLDPAGAPQVGPRSAGAAPGPVCYRAGGTEPTITDCNLVLGWLDTGGLAGGTVRLDAEAAHGALAAQIAGPLGMSVETAAYGAVEIATATMIRAIRAVSSERGRDPRDFTLVAFGGNGGIFGPLIARTLGIGRVVIPPSPGLFSAVGLLEGVVEHSASRTHKVLLAEADPATVGDLLQRLADEMRSRLAGSGHGDGAEDTRQARLRYHGQSFELAVAVPEGAIDRAALTALGEAFGAEHERIYGHRAGVDEPVELVSLAVIGRAPAKNRPPLATAAVAAASRARRSGAAYFGPAAGWQEAALLQRSDLAVPRLGPMIIHEYDATLVIPPGCRASLAEGNSVLVDVGPA